MTFYSGLIILTELLMLAMSLHVINYTGFTKRQKTWFLATFLTIFVCSAAEFAVHCGIYDPDYARLLTVLTIIQFSLAPVLGILFIGALGMEHQKWIAIGFFIFNLFVEVGASFSGWIFSFTETGYVRGPGFHVYEAFSIISYVYLITGLVMVGKKFRHRDALTIVMSAIILAVGIIPMAIYRLNITYIAVAVSACLCYIYYNDLVQQNIKDELIAKQDRLSKMQEHIISGMANVIEGRDIDTGEHITRTSRYVKTLALNARKDGVYSEIIDDRFISMMTLLAPMHDVGKIVVSDAILKKPGKLTREEYEQMKLHAESGGDIIHDILGGIADKEYIDFAFDIVVYHHERWDGKGYPKGLKGEEIPLSARIMAIADVFDALISERCYKEPMTREEAFKIIEEGSGTHFDPKLAKVFLDHKEDFR